MDIAVFGWYGHDNAGDESIKYALSKFLLSLGGINKVDFFDLYATATSPNSEWVNDYHLVIIGGGGLILSQANFHSFIEKIKTNLVVLGISVEVPYLSGNIKKFAQALLEKSAYFFVRDQESYRKLASFDKDKKIKVSSDLTFLEPYEVATKTTPGTLGINLLAKPKLFSYSALGKKYVLFILSVLQKLKLANLIHLIDFNPLIETLNHRFEVRPIPLYCCPQAENIATYAKNDIQLLRDYFTDVPSSFNDAHLDPCEAFISMRLHGAIFAVQKAIPLISLAYLPKNYAFMKEVGLQDFVTSAIDPATILPLLDKLYQEKAQIQEKMHHYRYTATKQIREDVENIINKIL